MSHVTILIIALVSLLSVASICSWSFFSGNLDFEATVINLLTILVSVTIGDFIYKLTKK
jgi:hypothetical protein